MKTHTFELTNAHGLHARPAGMLVETCAKFKSDIALIKQEKRHNAKSILSILKMAGSKGDQLTLEINGEDEDEAFNAFVALVDANFNE